MVKQLNGMLRNLGNVIFTHPYLTLGAFVLATLFFATRVADVRVYSEFADLLPQQHAYIKLHNEIKDTFGGANLVSVAVEVDDGTIFTHETLGIIHRVTQAVDSLPGVNHNLVASLTHRSSRKLFLTDTGSIKSNAYYAGEGERLGRAELDQMRADVIANPQIYGPLVSPDLKTALVKAQLNENRLDYEATFDQLQALRSAETRPGVKIHVTGQPVLVGWVYAAKPQILRIFAYTAAVILAILVIYFRRLFGVIVPLLAVATSAIWGIGIVGVLQYSIDPLTLVIPFLISARALSHGIQIVERYYDELATDPSSSGSVQGAARRTFENLFRPGALGVVSDAIGLALIMLGSVPLNVKLGKYASLWALSSIGTVLIAVPLLLSILPAPRSLSARDGFLQRLLPGVAKRVVNPRVSKTLIAMSVVAFAIAAFATTRVGIGNSEPGSPIFYRDHDYNLSSEAINHRFPGSEELYVVFDSGHKGGIKSPEALDALEDFRHHMMTDPEVGGSKGVSVLTKQVNRLLHATDPGFAQIPHEASYVGGLLFTYMASSPLPGALAEFIDPDERVANMAFFYKDRSGETTRRALHMAQQWRESRDAKEGLDVRLAGGTIGVAAAMNEASYNTNLVVIPLVFVLIFVAVALSYSSVHAGALISGPMLSATALTYAYMGASGMAITINTVPIIAVGIGVGIDYSIYMMDRIREEMSRIHELGAAVVRAITTTGRAVGITALTLIAGVAMWALFSDIRFQADSARLLTVIIILNATAAMFLVPALVIVFRPKFIVGLEERRI